MKNLFEQRKIPASIAEKDVHSLASVLKVKQIREETNHWVTNCPLLFIISYSALFPLPPRPSGGAQSVRPDAGDLPAASPASRPPPEVSRPPAASPPPEDPEVPAGSPPLPLPPLLHHGHDLPQPGHSLGPQPHQTSQPQSHQLGRLWPARHCHRVAHCQL